MTCFVYPNSHLHSEGCFHVVGFCLVRLGSSQPCYTLPVCIIENVSFVSHLVLLTVLQSVTTTVSMTISFIEAK